MSSNERTNGDPRRADDGFSPVLEACADAVLWGEPAPEAGDPSRDGRLAAELLALELTGAAVAAAMLADDIEEPPAEVRARLEQRAVRFLMQEHGLRLGEIGQALDAAPARPRAPRRVAGDRATATRSASPAVARDGGARVIDTTWISNLVAAAALIVAFALYWTRPAATPPIEAQYSSLLTSPTLVRFDWADGPSALGGEARGHVVWDPAAQRGFMVFDELAPNRSTEFQYQLWIFDEARGVNIPVDGGLFDIGDGSGPKIVPITAKIPVREAFAFAVTAERPGGVVVSKREEIISVAGSVGAIGPPKLN